jgi:hypothetical protein
VPRRAASFARDLGGRGRAAYSRPVPGVLKPAAILALFASAAVNAQAERPALHGHVKPQAEYDRSAADTVDAALGYRDVRAGSLDLRLIGTVSSGRFAFEADYWLQAVGGDAVTLRRSREALAPNLFVDRAATQWLRLDDTITDSSHTRAVQSLDRFSMTYTSEKWVFKLGRQAYSWGNGIVFRPMDLFDPFAPDAVDTSYKPGIDAVYTQRLFANGSDVAMLIVPRRDPATGLLEDAQSSAALKWHGFGAKLQMDVLAARDYRDTVLGLGLSGAWGQAVWRMSIVPTRLDAGGTRTSMVANVEQAWAPRGLNLSGFLEYFRNGFGRADRGYVLDELDSDLVARLARGQLFDTGRDYLAAGLRIQCTPLLEVDPVLLLNGNDKSSMLLLQGSYSVTQNLGLDFGAQVAIGPGGTEFGGLPTSAGGGIFDTPPTRLYARFAFYF